MQGAVVALDQLIATCAREYFPERGCSVGLAHTLYRRKQASVLMERMYASRGYQTDVIAKLPLNSNRTTLEVSGGARLFGTAMVGIDSEHGLFADTLYSEELRWLRMKGCKLSEVSNLAVDPQHGSKEVLASLFHLVYIMVRIIHKATEIIIEVNPRHAAFYERRLGFRQFGDARTCPRVNAPAVLLRIELAYMDAQIAKHAGVHESKERSLYPYFFTNCEAERVVNMVAQTNMLAQAA